MSLYLEHFGLVAAPFRITPHTGFFFPGGKRGATLAALIHAVTHEEGIVKVCGEVGSGKTMLCRMLLEKLPPAVETLYIANPSLSRDEMLATLADELGLPAEAAPAPYPRLRAVHDALLTRHANGRRVALLIDEAHAMPAETLEEVRLISNLETGSAKLLQIVLFAQPELDQRLAADTMRPLRERITQHFHISPFNNDEVGKYLEFRLRTAGYRGPTPFTPHATGRIARASLGLSRRINILADKALLAAYAAGSHRIDRRETQNAIADARFMPLSGARAWLRPVPATLAVVGATLLLAGTLFFAFRSGNTQPASPVSPPPPALPATSLREIHRQAFATWLTSAPRQAYFIQLFSAPAGADADIAHALTSVRANLDPAQIRLYHSSRPGEDRIGIVYGEFADRSAARRAIAALPHKLRLLHPYPRQVARLL